MIRKGSCHCGRVQFTAEFPDEELAGSRCNCTICAMKGALMIYLPLAAVTVTSGPESLATYRFNTMAAQHHFCPACGIHLFHQTRSNPELYALNAATLEGVQVYEDFPQVFVNDGQHHQNDNAGKRRLAGTLRFEPSADGEWPTPGW